MLKTLFVALACLLVVISAENVLVLTTETFDQTIADNEFVLVEFYAPWCGHCKKLAPEYEKAATQLKEEGSEIVLANVDATVETSLAQTYGVKGYPTLIFFKNGVQQPYEGDRVAPGIVNWLKKKSGPAATAVESKEQYDALVATVSGKVIGFFADAEAPELAIFLQAAADPSVEDFTFVYVLGQVDFVEAAANTVKVITADGKENTLEGDVTKQAIVKFVDEVGYPLVPSLEQKVFQRAAKAGANLLVAFVERTNTEQVELLNQVATQIKDQGVKATAAYLDEHKQLAERWGTSGKVFPTAILIKFGTQGAQPDFVIFDEEKDTFDLETVVKFVTDGVAGTYVSYRKSEPVPETNDESVYVLVGSVFEDIVLDETKDVLVEFYAPWCGHCKKLAPIYDELGDSYKENENVIIAKIDATANGLPDFVSVTGFPTIIYFPANNKKGITFSGERDLKGLAAFVEQHASNLKTDL